MEVGAVAQDGEGKVVADLTTLCLADSGCGRSMGNHPKQFESGSIVDHHQNCDTAAGPMTTKQRGTLAWTVPTNGARPGLIRCVDSTLNESCLSHGGRARTVLASAIWLGGGGAQRFRLAHWFGPR